MLLLFLFIFDFEHELAASSLVDLLGLRSGFLAPPSAVVDDFASQDVSGVDVVFISSARNMLALPYLLMRGFAGECSFAHVNRGRTGQTHVKGNIYATPPTIESARQLMTELVTHIEALSVLDYADDAWQRRSLLAQLPAQFQSSFSDALKCETTPVFVRLSSG